MRYAILIRCLTIAAGGVVLLGGCTAEPAAKKPSFYDRQEAALKNPFGYSPDMGKPDDISGGGIGSFDSKAMQKDADHVLNP